MPVYSERHAGKQYDHVSTERFVSLTGLMHVTCLAIDSRHELLRPMEWDLLEFSGFCFDSRCDLDATYLATHVLLFHGYFKSS